MYFCRDFPEPDNIVKKKCFSILQIVLIYVHRTYWNRRMNIPMRFVDNFRRDLPKNISMQFGDTLVREVWFVKMSKYRNLHGDENSLMEQHFGLLSCCWRWFSHISKISSRKICRRILLQDSSLKRHLLASSLDTFHSWGEMERGEEKTNKLISRSGPRSTAGRVINSCTTFSASNSFNTVNQSRIFFTLLIQHGFFLQKRYNLPAWLLLR